MGKKTTPTINPMKRVQKIFRERGTTALQMAKKEILSENIESSKVHEALTYFMTEYWRDTTRPALLSLVCEAVGGRCEATTPLATSAILMSGGVDIHDDIIDGSKTKEAGSTVFGKFGRDVALLAGDALLFKGLTFLFQTMEKTVPILKLSNIIDITKRTFFELGDAEALELHFRRRTDISPEEYLHVLKKKAAVVEGYTQIGAIVGGGSKKQIEDLGKFGKALGVLTLLRDDIIDMIDVEETRHRIEKESLPLPVIYALQNPKFKPTIVPYLLKKKITKKDAKAVIRIATEAGGTKLCRELMQETAKEAYNSLEGIKTNKQDLELLIQAVTWIQR